MARMVNDAVWPMDSSHEGAVAMGFDEARARIVLEAPRGDKAAAVNMLLG